MTRSIHNSPARNAAFVRSLAPSCSHGRAGSGRRRVPIGWPEAGPSRRELVSTASKRQRLDGPVQFQTRSWGLCLLTYGSMGVQEWARKLDCLEISINRKTAIEIKIQPGSIGGRSGCYKLHILWNTSNRQVHAYGTPAGLTPNTDTQSPVLTSC